MRRIAALALVGAAALAAGCGDDKTSSLKDNQATGPGFEFQLPDGYKAFHPDSGDKRSLSKYLSKQLPGFDLAGFADGGYWFAPSEDKLKPFVNVTIEPVTADTKLDDAEDSSEGLIRSQVGSVQPLSGPRRLDGTPARTAAFTQGKFDHRDVTAQHGEFAYSVNVQTTKGHPADVAKLTKEVASSWRWKALDAPAIRKLEDTRRLRGTGYTVTLPVGWRGTTKKALAGSSGTSALDSLWRGHIGPGFAANVNVAVGPLKARADTAGLARQVVAAERAGAKRSGGKYRITAIRRGPDTSVDGREAATIDVTSVLQTGLTLRQNEVVATDGTTAARITLTTTPRRYAKDATAVKAALRSWRWTP